MVRNQSEKLDYDLNKLGIVGLDEILLGGIPSGNIVLIQGTPGTGKTTLALESIVRGARDRNEPGVIITFELSPAKLLRDAESFGWDLQTLEKEKKVKIVYTSPSVLIQELHSEQGVLATSINTMQAKRVVLDGLSPLRLHSEAMSNLPYRQILHTLVETLQSFNVTALLTHELTHNEAPSGPEQFVCDTIISLSQQPIHHGVHRSVEITKSRGQGYIPGRHTLRIEKNRGVRVYPRASARPVSEENQPTSSKKSSVGNPGLDVMLGGGVFDGSITLTVGISGTGKTVAGLQFLAEGARQGLPGLLITLDEHPAQILRNSQGMNLGISEQVEKGNLHIHYDSPLELELDVHFQAITELVEKHNIKRVVVDSLAAYEVSQPDAARDFIYALATFFKDKLITAFFNYESPELLGVSQISAAIKASTTVDNIVLLNYVEVSTKLRRAVTVPKARGSLITQETREYIITQGGIAMVDENRGEAADIESVPQLPFSSYYGILARSPARRSPVIDEFIANGKQLPDSPTLQVDGSSNVNATRKN